MKAWSVWSSIKNDHTKGDWQSMRVAFILRWRRSQMWTNVSPEPSVIHLKPSSCWRLQSGRGWVKVLRHPHLVEPERGEHRKKTVCACMCLCVCLCVARITTVSQVGADIQRQTEPGMTLPINKFDHAHVVCFQTCFRRSLHYSILRCPTCLQPVLP